MIAEVSAKIVEISIKGTSEISYTLTLIKQAYERTNQCQLQVQLYAFKTNKSTKRSRAYVLRE